VTHASTETTKVLHKEASVAVATAANGAAILETRPTKTVTVTAAISSAMPTR